MVLSARCRCLSDIALGWWYEVRAGGRTLQLEERFLDDFEGEASPLDWISHPAGSAREITATLTWAKLKEHLTDTLYVGVFAVGR